MLDSSMEWGNLQTGNFMGWIAKNVKIPWFRFPNISELLKIVIRIFEMILSLLRKFSNWVLTLFGKKHTIHSKKKFQIL